MASLMQLHEEVSRGILVAIRLKSKLSFAIERTQAETATQIRIQSKILDLPKSSEHFMYTFYISLRSYILDMYKCILC